MFSCYHLVVTLCSKILSSSVWADAVSSPLHTFTFQRVGAAHTRLLTLCVRSPGAEPWATRTLVITRPLLETHSIGRFLSALQGCREASWHGFLKFSTGPCNYTSLDMGAVVDWRVLVDSASTRLMQSAFISKSNDNMLCVFLDFEQPALYFLPYLPWWPHPYNHSWIEPHWLTSARGSRDPEQYFWSGMHTQEQKGARCPIWCGKKWLLEHFCSFCLKKVSFTKLTVWIVPGYSHGPVLRQPSASPGHSLYFCSRDYCGYAAQAVCALAGSFTNCISSFPKPIFTKQTSSFKRKSCKDTSDWG